MKNILIVCADKDLRKDLSKALSEELKCLYLDTDDLLGFEILNRQEISLSEANEAMREMERNSIKRVVEFENCIVTISHDLYVSNDNFKLFNNMDKVYIELSKAYFIARANQADKYNLEQDLCLFDQINALITSNCDIVIKKDAKSIEELCKEIIKNLKQKKSH